MKLPHAMQARFAVELAKVDGEARSLIEGLKTPSGTFEFRARGVREFFAIDDDQHTRVRARFVSKRPNRSFVELQLDERDRAPLEERLGFVGARRADGGEHTEYAEHENAPHHHAKDRSKERACRRGGPHAGSMADAGGGGFG